MRIVLGADHAGFEMKQNLLTYVRELGDTAIDAGTNSTAPVDYPDYAEAVGMAVQRRQADRAILICGSGVGASVAANKIPGIRAGLCHDTYSAHQGVEHDNMNVLVLGSRVVGAQLAQELVRSFLAAQFTHEERHVRRLAKVDQLEHKFLEPAAEGDDFTANELSTVRGWLGGKATTIYGGSQEIQSNIISKRILGLPDPASASN